MSPFDVGAFGFWMFIAAVVVAGTWSSARKSAEKHETLRRIVEKTGSIDEAKLKELFKEDSEETKPGEVYRGLRIGGMIIMFVGAGMALSFLILVLLGNAIGWWFGGLAVSAGIAMLGLGVFISSRFAELPPGSRNDPPVR